MNAVDYTRRLRRITAVSWLGSLMVILGLVWLDSIPFHEFIPFLAILIGTIPIIGFVRTHKATCESCGGRMKISSGYPRIVYQCKKCKSEIATGVYSDF